MLKIKDKKGNTVVTMNDEGEFVLTDTTKKKPKKKKKTPTWSY